MGLTLSNPIHMGWIEFFFLTHHDELGKNPLTRLLHTSIFVHSISHLKCKKNKKKIKKIKKTS